MNNETFVVCMSWACIYKESCLKWVENIIISDDDEAGYRAEWYKQDDDNCYDPVDGQVL